MRKTVAVLALAAALGALAWAGGGWVSNNPVPSVKVWRDASYHWDWNSTHNIKVSLTGDPNESYERLYLYEAVHWYPTIISCSAEGAARRPFVDEANIWHWWWYFDEVPPHFWDEFSATCTVCDPREGPGGIVWVMAWETHLGATPPRRKAAYDKQVP